MSLLRDLVITVGDAMRLSSDLMRYKLEAQTKALKRGLSRGVLFLTLSVIGLLLAGTGAGFILSGIFVYVARETGPALAGLIIGLALLVVAIVVFLVGRAVLRRS